MGKRKNNDIGCIGGMIYIVFAMCAIIVIISAMGGIFAIVAMVAVIVFSAKIIYRILKKMFEIIKQKHNEAYSPVVETKSNSTIQYYFDGAGKEYDMLLLDAGKIVVDKEKASIGMLQREFKIGFNRADRIMNQLHECNVVGSEVDTAPRKVLMTTDEFDIFKSQFKGFLICDYKKYETEYGSDFNNQLAERIEMYNNKFDYMEGHEFEYYCANILEKNGFNDVEVTPGSGDNGIDIIAYKDYVKYGIQCKCYSSDIGIKAVQEVFAGAKYYDCHVPVVLTNRYFTRQAKELAEKTNVLLWDRDKLNELINNIG